VGSIVDGDVEVFRRSMEVRFWGALWACRYGAPRMDRGGSITLCSGLVAHRPRAGRAVGTAATAAVEAFARAMALELAPIRVNAVCPGGIDTPLLQREFGDKRDELVASLARRLPIGRPEDVAGAILFLMGNGFVTGITLVVDGGGLLT
jgi:NAD(P)-dependent dehydrogenase (short-subunit alcohol dehydrogenase family)